MNPSQKLVLTYGEPLVVRIPVEGIHDRHIFQAISSSEDKPGCFLFLLFISYGLGRMEYRWCSKIARAR